MSTLTRADDGGEGGLTVSGSPRALLAGHPLWRGVRADGLGHILARIPIKTVPRGTLLHAPGVLPGLLLLVLRGRLRAYQVTADGRELLLELIRPGGFDGLLSVTGRRGHFTEADEDSLVASVAFPTLESLMALEPRVARNLLHLIVERLEGREVHLEAIALHDPTQRLARQLLALGETLGRREGERVVIETRITHQMLADMLGVRRETVTLHLARMAEGVSLARGRLTLDMDALRGMVADPDDAERT